MVARRAIVDIGGELQELPVGDTLAGVTEQDVYDNSSPARKVLTGAIGPFVIADNATPIGTDLFAVERNDGTNYLSVQADEMSIGPAGRRLFRPQWPDATGRFGCEIYPDDFSITTATGTANAAFFTDGGRTITLNIPLGGGLGNDTAPGGMNFTHKARFEDTGFVFAAQLLINAAVQVECATNTVGPLYLFLDQYNTYADGGSRTCTQHNAMRAQPRWGPNINGGSITQTSAELYFAGCTVDATVGSASITNCTHFTSKGVTLTAGGTIGTFKAYELLDVPAAGVTTAYGIFSTYSNADEFIRHEGTSISSFAGDIHMNDGVSLVFGSAGGSRVEFLRPFAGAVRMIGVGGSFNEGLDWDFQNSNNVAVTSSTSAGLNFDLTEIAFGPSTVADGSNNWVFAFSPGVRATQLGGDYSEVLFTSSSAITVAHAIGTFATWTINFPSVSIGAGSVTNATNVLIQTNPNVGTGDRTGLRITSNPSGGGGINAALYVTAGLSRFDGRVDINRPIALGGGATATLGTIGGSGPTTAAQQEWVEIDVNGNARWMAVWA